MRTPKYTHTFFDDTIVILTVHETFPHIKHTSAIAGPHSHFYWRSLGWHYLVYRSHSHLSDLVNSIFLP